MLIRTIALTAAALAAFALPSYAGRNPSGLHSHIELDCRIGPTSSSNGKLVAWVTPRGALPAKAERIIVVTLPEGSLRFRRTPSTLLLKAGEPVPVPINGQFESCQANLQVNLPDSDTRPKR